MTRTEVIEQMEARFYDSLAMVAECLNETDSQSQSATGGQSAAGSAPSSGIQGTESATLTSTGTDDGEEETSFAADDMDDLDSSIQTNNGDLRLQGKVPEDIPSPDNDTVLQAQLRKAAMQEQDPVLKQKMWNEYRRYAGLPLQEISDNNIEQTETESENNETASQSAGDLPLSSGVQGAESATLALTGTDDGDLRLQGKVPEDIPSPDNDTALQAQLRKAAMQEQDPVLKQKMWNEYRRYAGLPLQEISDNNIE